MSLLKNKPKSKIKEFLTRRVSDLGCDALPLIIEMFQGKESGEVIMIYKH